MFKTIIYLCLSIFFSFYMQLNGQENLRVEGDGRFINENPRILLTDSDDNLTKGQIEVNGNNFRFLNGSGNIEFWNGTSNILFPRFHILGSNGNIGIGVQNPIRTLDVNGETWMRDDLTIDFADLVLRSDNNHTYRLRTANNGDLHFLADGSTNMILSDASGYLGIGTTSPNAKLHIDGGNEATLTDHGHMLIGELNEVNMALDNNEIQVRSSTNSPATLYLQGDGGNVSVDGNSLFIDSNANEVGIRTSSPTRTLDVNGNARIRNIPFGNGNFLLADSSGNLFRANPPSFSEFCSQSGKGGSSLELLLQKLEKLQIRISNLEEVNKILKDAQTTKVLD